jgi:two-component system C4-dicarboxylate transport sensor histidine kinase DctB
MSGGGPSRTVEAGGLAAVHARFARAVLTIYLVTAAVAVLLLVGALITDLTHQKDLARDTLLLETEVRAHYLGIHLAQLATELSRLGLRSEVNLLDQNNEPERSLLRLAHERSSFFNVGVAVVGPDGVLVRAEPDGFLPVRASFAGDPWFQAALRTRALLIVPVEPERARDSLLYMVSPILREGKFSGVLLGAIDLAVGDTLNPEIHPGAHRQTLLVGHDGTVIYPPRPPLYAANQEWRAFVAARSSDPFIADRVIDGRDEVLTGAPVQGTDFLLLSVAASERLFGPARSRLITRLGLGLALALVPFLLLVHLLRRSFRVFERSEHVAVRGEQLRMLGEASSLIAHEVKNALNGLRVGLDVVVQGLRGEADGRQQRAIDGLRTEVERLSSFTTELLSFSRGVVPRPVPLDLGGLVEKIAGLHTAAAARLGVGLVIDASPGAVAVRADPSLLHVVVTNLVVNALEALSGGPRERPAIRVAVGKDGSTAQVRVSDNGPGVPGELRPRLFEPFVTGKPSGVGIGLAMSRRIALAHGGDLVLERVGPGASFLLTLPVEER